MTPYRAWPGSLAWSAATSLTSSNHTGLLSAPSIPAGAAPTPCSLVRLLPLMRTLSLCFPPALSQAGSYSSSRSRLERHRREIVPWSVFQSLHPPSHSCSGPYLSPLLPVNISAMRAETASASFTSVSPSPSTWWALSKYLQSEWKRRSLWEVQGLRGGWAKNRLWSSTFISSRKIGTDIVMTKRRPRAGALGKAQREQQRVPDRYRAPAFFSAANHWPMWKKSSLRQLHKGKLGKRT